MIQYSYVGFLIMEQNRPYHQAAGWHTTYIERQGIADILRFWCLPYAAWQGTWLASDEWHIYCKWLDRRTEEQAIVQNEGTQKVERDIAFYNLDMIASPDKTVPNPCCDYGGFWL